ncbi:MAG: DCC1-like thiol-disulfide oxidoreductase family protein [Planctomycetota bacterium]
MPEMVFYDGDCALCHRSVTFILRRDPDGSRFTFSPIGSNTFNQRIPADQRQQLPDSIVVQCDDGTLLVRSNATLHILQQLGGVWKPFAQVAALIPRPLRDWVYRCVAAVRHRFFKKPADACPMMPPELRSRFHL